MNKKVMRLASRGKRFGAYCIDKIVPFILFMMVVTTMATAGLGGSMGSYPYGGYGYDFGLDYGMSMGTNYWGIALKLLFAVVISLAYLAVQIVFYSKSKTIGKAILGLQVISSIDGQPIGLWKMILREWFAKKASGAAFMLGYLWVLIDDKNRGWHDKIMDTYVIDAKESSKLNAPEPKSEPIITIESSTPIDVTTVEDIESTEIENINIDNVEKVDDIGGETLG